MSSAAPRTTFAVLFFVCGVVSIAVPTISWGQDLDPRRWDHLPIDLNVAGTALVYTDGKISFDPVLQIEDAVMARRTYAFKYLRSFELLGKSARLELLQTYVDVEWSGLLAGAPASAIRKGWGDTEARFAVNLIGAPQLTRAVFSLYRANLENETIVGAGLVVQFPTGEYLEDKLLNIGTNRYIFRPQLGILHRHRKLSIDITFSSWLYTDNNEFIINNKLEQDPLHVLQAHGVYSLAPACGLAPGSVTATAKRRRSTAYRATIAKKS